VDSLVFTESDLEQIRILGVTEGQVQSQIAIFEKGRAHLKLSRPARVGDGIIRISEDAMETMNLHHQEAASTGRMLKFVPASGTASRMFKVLVKFNNENEMISREELARRAAQGEQEAKECLTFLDGIRRFAFFEDLKRVMSQNGFDLESLLGKGQIKEILEYLLTVKGLDYASLPKGLLKFHRYHDGSRTAVEEHLVEAAAYVQDAAKRCRIHFSVSPEHRDGFTAFLEGVKGRYEAKLAVEYQVAFSVQKPSTNTIAVDMADRPFRDQDGWIVFRPGGHGALIENLNDIQGDIIYIKNIDNVVPDRLKGETLKWKRILGGFLVATQKRIFGYLNQFTEGSTDTQRIEDALAFVSESLQIPPPEGGLPQSLEAKKEYLVTKLNRPIRVCGVVRNVREPGGGPFWVEENDGSQSLQIVENAQVDKKSEKQQKIWNSATHFNPVDIVCGVRDFRGEPFDLSQYVDRDAVIISQKSKDGRELKALELPGLWNGAMADWISLFVEVPLLTFNPVKTVNDLLRQEHQPGE